MLRPLAAVVFLTSAAALAQPPPEEPAISEEQARSAGLTGTVRGERSVLKEPQAIGVLNREDLERTEGLFLEDTLDLVPGVRFETRTVSGG